MTSLPQQPGAPAAILLREETADDKNNYHSVYMRIKVLTEAGRKYADVELPYNRRNFTIAQISGRTVHTDGSVVPFEGKPFDKVVVKGHGARYQVKSFTLPDVQVGSILDFRYSLRYADNVLIPPQWIVQDELFQKKATFKYIPFQGKGNTEVVLAHGQLANHVAWTPYLPKEHLPQERSNPMSYWVDLDLNDVPPFVKEPFMPPLDVLLWRVNFYYQVGTKPEEYWKDQGKFWNKDIENFLGRKRGVQEVVAQIVATSDSPEQKVHKIYAYVAQLENQSYAPFRAQQEERVLGLKPNQGVEDVLQQRSGGHDDLARLFVAMVHAAGIPAWLMRVPSRERTFFDTHFLSTEQLDAEIAIVQLDGKEVFLDPGTKFCPYALTDWRYSNAQGLRQSATKGTEIGQSPLPDYRQAKIVRVAHLKLTEQGKIEGTINTGFFGLEALNRRHEGGKTDAEGRKKLLEDEVRSWLPGNSDVTLTKVPQWDNAETPLVAEFNVSSPLVVSAGKRLIIPTHVFQNNQKALFPSADRANPIYFYYPSQEVDELHITLPSELDVESLPANDLIKLDYAIYQTQQVREPANNIVLVRNLIMGGMAFPLTGYKGLKSFYDQVKVGDDQQVILKGSARAAGN
jgi:hypothetical protein